MANVKWFNRRLAVKQAVEMVNKGVDPFSALREVVDQQKLCTGKQLTQRQMSRFVRDIRVTIGIDSRMKKGKSVSSEDRSTEETTSMDVVFLSTRW